MPRSYSCISATDAMGLVMEKMRKMVSSAIGRARSRSISPSVRWYATRPWRITAI